MAQHPREIEVKTDKAEQRAGEREAQPRHLEHTGEARGGQRLKTELDAAPGLRTGPYRHLDLRVADLRGLDRRPGARMVADAQHQAVVAGAHADRADVRVAFHDEPEHALELARILRTEDRGAARGDRLGQRHTAAAHRLGAVRYQAEERRRDQGAAHHRHQAQRDVGAGSRFFHRACSRTPSSRQAPDAAWCVGSFRFFIQ